MSFWDNMADKEEIDKDDECVNRALRWKEIVRNLDNVKSILDIGGATGAFSIPLAQKGYIVTHLDISEKMIDRAKDKAQGLKNITFGQADAKDLSMFEDNSFDLVLNLDGAISFSGKYASTVISESCRVAKNKVLLSASNKSSMTATWLDFYLKESSTLGEAVFDMMEHGTWDKDACEDNKRIYANYFPIQTFKAYTPKEFQVEIEKNNVKVKFSRSIGSLTHLILVHLLRQDATFEQKSEILKSPEFIDLCEGFDIEVMPEGPGSFRRAGVLALAEK